MMHNMNEFSSREQLDVALADKVASILVKAVEERGRASIAVSGGSTPKGFFSALSQKPLPWQAITVTLADERWVEETSDASNTQLVRNNLLINQASKATFFPLKRDGSLNQQTLAELNEAATQDMLPFDVVILGMGEDGHTASLFPCSAEIHAALAVTAEPLLPVQPTTAPHQRITFSFDCLAKSHNAFLHIVGDNKQAVLTQAIAGKNTFEMPIRAFLYHPSLDTQIYWAK